jgi:hypothetical protein
MAKINYARFYTHLPQRIETIDIKDADAASNSQWFDISILVDTFQVPFFAAFLLFLLFLTI